MSPRDEHGSTFSELPAKDQMALVDAGISTEQALLNRLPRRYEDRRNFDAFPTQASGEACCLEGIIMDTSRKRFGGKAGFYEAVVVNQAGGVFGSGKITCRWFNMPYIHKVIAAGQHVVLYGKVKDSGGRLIIDHPEFEIIVEGETAEDSIHLGRIVPIYRNVPGITQRHLREIMHGLLENKSDEAYASELGLCVGEERRKMFHEIHFPSSLDSAKTEKRMLALEEFFKIQLSVGWRKRTQQMLTGRVLGKRTKLLTSFYESLPFDLTEAQKRSIREIVADMRKPAPMQRLLQGDVGAGKTFVAMAAILLAVESDCDAALMAPTQILAEQHFLTFKKWLAPIGVNVVLRTANRRENEDGGSRGKVIIGTHALLFDESLYDDLGLVVIDEQHKFGVKQRGRLMAMGNVPDVLVMTATPIPRTLTMTLYGDLEVSLLDEKPPGRGKVTTALRVKPKQTDVTKFLKEKLSSGRQAYLVYPLVEESEQLDLESAITAADKWQKRISTHRVGLLHGKMPAEEKEKMMEEFRAGNIAALVCTSVIEVGVDVANASVMIIHHAERFGLAQLHQLRGRVGRGQEKSYCILISDGKNDTSLEKLKVLERSVDGFEIAEADLLLRGPGDVLGTKQSGLGEMRFVDFLSDTQLLIEARKMADEVFHRDPDLTGQHAGLRAVIDSQVDVRAADEQLPG